jgi:hypothetical protein
VLSWSPVQQEIQETVLQEVEESARSQRQAEELIRMGESISRGCVAVDHRLHRN